MIVPFAVPTFAENNFRKPVPKKVKVKINRREKGTIIMLITVKVIFLEVVNNPKMIGVFYKKNQFQYFYFKISFLILCYLLILCN